MRLLSNLYKQRFITNESESRVINSNTLAYRILEEQSRALAKTREPEQPQAESGGFVEGIAAPQVETIDYEAEAKEKSRRNFSTGKCRSRRNPKKQPGRKQTKFVSRHRNRDRQKVWNRECRKVLRFMMQS